MILFNHRSSHIPYARAQSSASMLLLTTTGCFLLLQVTRLPYINVQYLVVDFLSLAYPAQSVSMNASIFLESIFFKKSPFPGVPVRYLKIQ